MAMKETELPIYDSAVLKPPFIYEFTELIHYRYLLWNLITRDLKVRYKRSVLGFVWAMLNPLLTMGVLYVVFSALFRFDVDYYPIYLLSGILVWDLFSRGTLTAMGSGIGNGELRKKIYIPASIFVASSIGSALVNLLFALIPLLIITLFSGLPPRLTWLLLPIPIIQTTLFAFCIGLVVSALVVFFNDIVNIYEVALNAYFFLTPIIYPVTILTSSLLMFQKFNPMFYFASSFRVMLIEGIPPSFDQVIIATLAAGGVAIIGWSLFTKLSDKFAYHT